MEPGPGRLPTPPPAPPPTKSEIKDIDVAIGAAEKLAVEGLEDPRPKEERKVELAPDARRMLEGRAGRLRDYAKAAIDAGDWAAAFEAIGKVANIERELAEPFHEKDRLADVERVLAALLAGARKEGHPHFAAVLEGAPLRFTFGRNASGGLAVDFAPLKAAKR